MASYHCSTIRLLHPSHVGQGLWEKGLRLSIQGTEELFVCFVPFPAPGLTDSLRSLGWRYPAFRHQETDRSLSEDVPGIPRGAMPCRGGALGFSEITTPIVKTVDECEAICYRFNYFNINLLQETHFVYKNDSVTRK